MCNCIGQPPAGILLYIYFVRLELLTLQYEFCLGQAKMQAQASCFHWFATGGSISFVSFHWQFQSVLFERCDLVRSRCWTHFSKYFNLASCIFSNLLGRIYFWPGQQGRTAQFGGWWPFIFHDLSWFSSKLHQFHLGVCCYVCSLPSVWTHDDPECLHIILFAWTYMSYIYVLWKIWKLAHMFAFVPPCSICMLEVAFPLVGSIVKGSKAPTLAAALCS